MKTIPIHCPFVLTELKTICYYQLTERYKFEGESHSNWEFLFVNSGNYTVYEENSEFLLSQSQGILHPPYCFHREIASQKNTSICVLGFHAQCEDLDRIASRVLTLNQTQKELLTDIYTLAIGTFDSQPSSWFSNRTSFVKTNVYGAEQIIKNKIELLFLSLLNQTEEPAPKKQTKCDLIQEIKESLSRKLDEPFHLETLSETLSYSPNYLCRVFKKATGETILQYYYRLKISRAQAMILESDMSFRDISTCLGFDTVQYFSSVFKKYTGLTPSQFRNAVITTNLINHTPAEVKLKDSRP